MCLAQKVFTFLCDRANKRTIKPRLHVPRAEYFTQWKLDLILSQHIILGGIPVCGTVYILSKSAEFVCIAHYNLGH